MLRIFLFLFFFMFAALPFAKTHAAEFQERVANLAEITDIRVSAEDNKVRIVADATKPAGFSYTALSSPDRIVVDIKNAWLSPKTKKELILTFSPVKRIRAAQFDNSTVRIVVETSVKKDELHIFSLEGGNVPARIVMDFGGEKQKSDTAAKPKNETVTKPKDDTNKKTEPPAPVEKTEKKSDPYDEPIPDDNPKEKYDDKNGKNKKDDESRDKKSTDEQIAAITGLKGKSITLDAGHGGPDAGAIGPTGVTEKSVTLRVANELKRLLENEGAKVYMTRTRDTAVSSKGSKATAIEELQARCDIANKKKSDIFISIHMDSFTNSEARGTTSYYYDKGSSASKKLADKVREGLIDQIDTQNRGTQSCNFYVVRHTDMPAILIEIAFISNPEEEKLLDSEEGVKKAAQGIADGIADYFG